MSVQTLTMWKGAYRPVHTLAGPEFRICSKMLKKHCLNTLCNPIEKQLIRWSTQIKKFYCVFTRFEGFCIEWKQKQKMVVFDRKLCSGNKTMSPLKYLYFAFHSWSALGRQKVLGVLFWNTLYVVINMILIKNKRKSLNWFLSLTLLIRQYFPPKCRISRPYFLPYRLE